MKTRHFFTALWLMCLSVILLPSVRAQKVKQETNLAPSALSLLKKEEASVSDKRITKGMKEIGYYIDPMTDHIYVGADAQAAQHPERVDFSETSALSPDVLNRAWEMKKKQMQAKGIGSEIAPRGPPELDGNLFPSASPSNVSFNALTVARSLAPSLATAYGGGGGGQAQFIPRTMADIRYLRDTLGYSPKDFGARGNGTTNDGAAFQATINAAPAGSRIIIPVGNMFIGSTAITVNKQLFFEGSAGGDRTVNSACKITSNSNTGVAITVSASGCNFANFALKNTSVGPVTAGAGILFTLGDFTRINNMLFAGFWRNVQFDRGCYYTVTNSSFHDCWEYGAFLQNQLEPDHGDPLWSGNVFTQLESQGRNALAAVRWRCGGGFKFVGNKINGYDPLLNGVGVTGKYVHGLHFTIMDSKSTSVFIIGNNSIEGNTVGGGAAITIEQETAGTGTGSFGKGLIVGNGISLNSNGIDIKGSVTNQIYGYVISGNYFEGLATAISLQHCDQFDIGVNTYRGLTTPVILKTGCTNINVVMPTVNGDNKVLYENQARSATTHATNNQTRFVSAREIPVTNSTTTYATLYTIKYFANQANILELTLTGSGFNVQGEFAQVIKVACTRHGNNNVKVTQLGTPLTAKGGSSPAAPDAALDLDYLFDTTSSPGYVIIKIRLKAGEAITATDAVGVVGLVIDGELSKLIKGTGS